MIDVSVVVTSLRFDTQLLPSLASVLRQKDASIEVLVADDSPEGSARSTVQALGDARVRYLPRAGAAGSNPALLRNDAAGIARGRYLHFLDDGDVLEADALSALKNILDGTPGAGMAFGAVVPFGADEDRLRQEQRYFREAARVARRLRGRLQLVKYLLFRPTILINSACMVRRQAFAEAGGYDAELPVFEHVDLWQRIARAEGFVYVDRPIVRYRAGAPNRMDALQVNDGRMDITWRRTQHKYRRTHGLREFLLLKLWARLAR